MRQPLFFRPRRLGRVAPAAALAAALLAALIASVSPASGASAASLPHCATSGLVIWLDTSGSGAAGSVFYNLEFTNLSGHKCTLHGFPGVSGVNLAGHRLGSAASFDHSVAAHTVTLAKGGQAHAVLRIVDAGNFPASSCHQVTAAGLRVFPPNQTASKVVPFPFQACSRSGPVYLSVRPVK
jgi:hypothetical protein